MPYNWDEQGFKKTYYRYRHDPVYPSGWTRCPKNEMLYCKCTNPQTLPEPSRSSLDDRYNMTYCRAFFDDYPLFSERAVNLISALSLAEGTTILVAGCAFGYLVEELNKREMIAYGFDNSRYIQQKKRLESTIAVHDIDLGSRNFVSEVRRKTKINRFDYIITEDVLTSFADAELDPLLDNCNLIADNVVHIVAQEAFPEFNVKTLTQWRAIRPSHTWLSFKGTVG